MVALLMEQLSVIQKAKQLRFSQDKKTQIDANMKKKQVDLAKLQENIIVPSDEISCDSLLVLVANDVTICLEKVSFSTRVHVFCARSSTLNPMTQLQKHV